MTQTPLKTGTVSLASQRCYYPPSVHSRPSTSRCPPFSFGAAGDANCSAGTRDRFPDSGMVQSSIAVREHRFLRTYVCAYDCRCRGSAADRGGISGSRWDPVRHVPWLFPPILASLLELGVVWLWHTPVLHSAARQNTAALVAEQGTFLLSGLVLWMAALGGDATFRGTRGASGIVALLLTAMHMTLLGVLLALAPRSLYEHRHGYSGLSALEDQHLGGAIMLIVGGLSYLAGGLWLSFELLRRENIPRRSAIEA